MIKDVSHNRFLILIGAVAVQTACNYHVHPKDHDHNLIKDNFIEISIKYCICLKIQIFIFKNTSWDCICFVLIITTASNICMALSFFLNICRCDLEVEKCEHSLLQFCPSPSLFFSHLFPYCILYNSFSLVE